VAIWRAVAVIAAVVGAMLLTPSILPVANIAAVLLVLAVVAQFNSVAIASPLRAALGAMAIFIVYRLALQAIPSVWMISDRIAQGLGHVAGFLTGQKLAMGPTFGGIDFLVLSGAFYVLWIVRSPAPRLRRALYGAGAILLAHFAYLALLSFVPAFLNNVPSASPGQPNPVWAIPLPGFLHGTLDLDAVAVRQFVPNNLPLFAVLFHLLVIGAMVRWGEWAEVERGDAKDAEQISGPAVSGDIKSQREIPPSRRAMGLVAVIAALVIALVLPAVVTYCNPARSLEGKKIVISDRLYGNFLKPQNGDYGHLSIGMYGDITPFIESLGGRAVVTSDLSDNELSDADALVLIYPNKPLADDSVDRTLHVADRYLGWSASSMVQQAQLARIWKWVDNGGTLLVMGEHTIYDESLPRQTRSYLNEILAPSAIRVNFDSAMFEIGGWLQSYQALSHPITAGTEDSRNQFGVVIGASLDVKFPARPVLVGRWGWADPGDEGNGASMMGNHHYDPGERLGDMILIAEQSYGKGRLVAFGDPSNVTNGITIGAHPFNGRLYSYLTHNPATDKDGMGDTPQSPRRQALGALLALALIVLLARNPAPLATAAIVLLMSLSLWFWNAQVAATAQVIPDGNKILPHEIYKEKGKLQPSYKSLAYIDNAHLGFFSEESWRPDGTMGLAMNLMRNDYLTLMAPDLKRERLLDESVPGRTVCKASLLVLTAPTKPLTAKERQTLRDYVSAGGELVMTIGWDRYESNRDLLADFGYYLEKIPLSAIPPDVVDAARRAKADYEILDVGVGAAANQGCYIFDLQKGDDAWEVYVSVNGGVLEQRQHTRDSLHHAMVLRGAIPPEPLGFFKVPYLGDLGVYVRFHSAWPIRCSDPHSVVAVVGRDEFPLIIWRPYGTQSDPEQWKGKVVLIGDSEFATNQNLENEGGQPFEGLRENADFWRWFISFYLRGEKPFWHPTPPAPAAPAKAKDPADHFNLEGK
jgi:hypothetical protein